MAATQRTFRAGRPPWYDRSGAVKAAFIIGVAGGSASGKTTVAECVRVHARRSGTWRAERRPPAVADAGRRKARMPAKSRRDADRATRRIMERLDVPWVALISTDAFYRPLTPEQLEQAHASNYNFDVPDAFDYPLMIQTLKQIKQGRQVEIPIYDFKSHSRSVGGWGGWGGGAAHGTSRRHRGRAP